VLAIRTRLRGGLCIASLLSVWSLADIGSIGVIAPQMVGIRSEQFALSLTVPIIGLPARSKFGALPWVALNMPAD
jgi:hypothetical protein